MHALFNRLFFLFFPFFANTKKMQSKWKKKSVQWNRWLVRRAYNCMCVWVSMYFRPIAIIIIFFWIILNLLDVSVRWKIHLPYSIFSIFTIATNNLYHFVVFSLSLSAILWTSTEYTIVVQNKLLTISTNLNLKKKTAKRSNERRGKEWGKKIITC